MNDRDCYCFQCNDPLYEHQVSDRGLCLSCEQERLARGWRQCAKCKRSIKDQPSDLCFACTVKALDAAEKAKFRAELDFNRRRTAATNAALKRADEEFWRTTKDHFGDEPSDEDLDYVYRSLGATNPNKESPVPPRKIPEEDT